MSRKKRLQSEKRKASEYKNWESELKIASYSTTSIFLHDKLQHAASGVAADHRPAIASMNTKSTKQIPAGRNKSGFPRNGWWDT